MELLAVKSGSHVQEQKPDCESVAAPDSHPSPWHRCELCPPPSFSALCLPLLTCLLYSLRLRTGGGFEVVGAVVEAFLGRNGADASPEMAGRARFLLFLRFLVVVVVVVVVVEDVEL